MASVSRPCVPTMRLLALPFALLLAVPVLAQDASLDVGAQSFDLRYAPGTTDAMAAPLLDFSGSVVSVGFYGASGAFSAFYGTDERLIGPEDPSSLSVYGLDISTGGNVPVVRLGEGIRYSGYVPIRAQIAYRYFLGDTAPGALNNDTSVHLAELDLGVGVGAAVDVPLSGSVARSARTFGTFVVGAGVQGDYFQGHPDGVRESAGYGLRSNTLMVQAEARGLFGTPVGASVGYTFRTARTNGASIESASGVFDGVTGGDFSRLETLHVVHVGLLF